MNVGESFERALEDVSDELRGSYVFLDETFADVFHWNVGGRSLLSRYSPANVFDIADFAASASAPHPSIVPLNLSDAKGDEEGEGEGFVKAVFFFGSFLHTFEGAFRNVLRTRAFDECVVLSAVSNLGHARCPSSVQRLFGAPGAYSWFTDIAKSEMTAAKSAQISSQHRPTLTSPPVAAVVHFPLAVCAFARDLFTVPVIPSSCVLMSDSTIGLLAERLASALTEMGARYDVWALGPTARRLAATLAPPVAQSTRPVSVIMIDRALDLVPCCSHGGNALDRVLALLRPLGSCDVRVNTSALLGGSITSDDTFGSLAHPEDSQSSVLLETALGMPMKQCTSLFLKKLKEVAPIQPRGTESEDTPIALLQRCATADTWPCDHAAIFDWCTAIAEATECSVHSLWDQLLAIEKVLLLTSGDQRQSIGESLLDLVGRPFTVDSGQQSKASVMALLCLCALSYSLVGQDAPGLVNEEALRSALVEELLASVSASPRNVSQSLWTAEELADRDDPEAMREAAERKIGAAFERLHAVASARMHCRDFASLTRSPGGSTASTYSGIVDQLLARLSLQSADGQSSASPQPIYDLQHSAGQGVGGLFKKGLGMWGFSGREPQPTDAPTIVFFFVGGVTCRELCSIRDFSSKRPGTQVLVGATCISNLSMVGRELFLP